MQNSSVVLEMSGLDGGPPQEVLVIEVKHGIVNIPHPLTIQTINDGGVCQADLTAHPEPLLVSAKGIR